jgi:hypothetical protein
MLIERRSTHTHLRATLAAPDLLAWRAEVSARQNRRSHRSKEGRIGWVLLWLLGIPLPILFGAYFLRGCT